MSVDTILIFFLSLGVNYYKTRWNNSISSVYSIAMSSLLVLVLASILVCGAQSVFFPFNLPRPDAGCDREPHYGEYCDIGQQKIRHCSPCSAEVLLLDYINFPEECQRLPCPYWCPEGAATWDRTHWAQDCKLPTPPPPPPPPPPSNISIEEALERVMTIDPQRSCSFDHFYNWDTKECSPCKPCSMDVIEGTSQDIGYMYECMTGMPCPQWCAFTVEPKGSKTTCAAAGRNTTKPGPIEELNGPDNLELNRRVLMMAEIKSLFDPGSTRRRMNRHFYEFSNYNLSSNVDDTYMFTVRVRPMRPMVFGH